MSKRNEKKIQLLESYNKGLEKYKERNFEEAIPFFQQVLSQLPNDGPSQLYADRCQLYIKEPPPDDWDGVFVMTTK